MILTLASRMLAMRRLNQTLLLAAETASLLARVIFKVALRSKRVAPVNSKVKSTFFLDYDMSFALICVIFCQYSQDDESSLRQIEDSLVKSHQIGLKEVIVNQL